jgi:imidazolonepropionase-like amidohydrolase
MTITPTAILGSMQDRMAADPGLLTDPRWKVLQPVSVTEGPGRAAAFGGDSATRKETAAGWRKAILDMTNAGVTVLAGTDSSLVPYGISLHYELEIEVAAGLTPFQALRTATANTAGLLNATKDLGTIEVGKLADMVVVEGDPLVDIRNARRVRKVIRGGEVIDLETLVNLSGR